MLQTADKAQKQIYHSISFTDELLINCDQVHKMTKIPYIKYHSLKRQEFASHLLNEQQKKCISLVTAFPHHNILVSEYVSILIKSVVNYSFFDKPFPCLKQ